MKPFHERNPRAVGAVCLGLAVLAVVGALTFSKLPFFDSATPYHADLANAGSLVAGEQVTLAGTRIGTITGLHLAGDHVRLDFQIQPSVHLGRNTSLAVKVLSPLGQEYVELTSHGPGTMSAGSTIPASRTSGTQTILSTLNQTGTTLGAIDEKQLARALATASADLSGTSPAAVAAAVTGLGRLSDIIAQRQVQLRQLVSAADQVTSTLNANRGQLLDLIGQGNLVLQVVEQRRAQIKQTLEAATNLANRITSIIGRQSGVATMLANLRSASAVLAHDSGTLSKALPLLAGLSTYLANATGSGPFFDAIAPTLLIDDHLIAECSPPGVTPPYNFLSQGCPK